MMANENIFLRLATDYYKEEKYPNPHYLIPPREEVESILKFTILLFGKICKLLDIELENCTMK